MSDREQRIEALNTLLNASLAGVSPATDLAAVLGLLEATRATGIFRAREGGALACTFYMRFSEGRIVKVLGGDAQDMISRMLRSPELFWTFKAVANPPHGDTDLNVTSLLLGATTQLDHDARDAALGEAPSLVRKSPTRRMGACLRLAG
jgi:hypothetical protein